MQRLRESPQDTPLRNSGLRLGKRDCPVLPVQSQNWRVSLWTRKLKLLAERGLAQGRGEGSGGWNPAFLMKAVLPSHFTGNAIFRPQGLEKAISRINPCFFFFFSNKYYWVSTIVSAGDLGDQNRLKPLLT